MSIRDIIQKLETKSQISSSLLLSERGLIENPNIHYDFQEHDFRSGLYVFYRLLMEMVWNKQHKNIVPQEEREMVAEEMGQELRKFVNKYTGVDTHELYEAPVQVPERQTVIVDVDGTVAEIGERVKLLKQKPVDWNKFYKSSFRDKPIAEMVELVDYLALKYKIVFCTARDERARKATEEWINQYFTNISEPVLLMRNTDDYRSDAAVKHDIVKDAGIDMEEIAFVLEDRAKVVDMWREKGIRCLQVAEGDF